VLCVAPAWNEGARIGRVVARVPRGIVGTVLVVDDGSTDDTGNHARAAGAAVVRHDGNRGVGAAIRTGIDYARAHGFDVVVVVSGGGKSPPEQIPRLLTPIAEGRADFVQGSRYLEGGEFLRMPWSRRWGTRAYTVLFSLFAGRRVTDASSGIRAFRLSIFDDRRLDLWQPWLDRYELEPYLLFTALRVGVRLVEVPITIEYPRRTDALPYTKMRAITGWWSIFRPVLLLALGLKR
jgi:dolichol-phosphate mannosyltransferase